MSANGAGFEVGVATQLGARLQIHHLQQRAYVLQQRGVLAVVRGYGGQSTGDVAVETVCQELDRELRRAHEPAVAVVEALARASARLRATPPDAGPRTASVTAAVIASASATVIHIGGGCAYLLRGHEVRP